MVETLGRERSEIVRSYIQGVKRTLSEGSLTRLHRKLGLPPAPGARQVFGKRMTAEILGAVDRTARVLDLGSGGGSFPGELCAGFVVRCDVDPSKLRGNAVVCADAGQLPFDGASFDLIVANHVLEHCTDASAVINEIGRIVKASGGVYVAIPDGDSFSDHASAK